MSEVDVHCTVLNSYTDVKLPRYLSSDSEGHVLVADYLSHHILLLNSRLELQGVLVDRNSQVESHPLWWPSRSCYNELASQLYVQHSSNEGTLSDVISLFNLR